MSDFSDLPNDRLHELPGKTPRRPPRRPFGDMSIFQKMEYLALRIGLAAGFVALMIWMAVRRGLI